MLLTKLHIPAPPKDTIHRQVLLNELDKAKSKKLLLVSAPAGYGKTTLISDWIIRNNITAVWCSLDERDNDPNDFFRILVTAINKKYGEIGKSALELLQAPGTANMQYIIELFLNDLLRLEEETVLVLDDLHLVENKWVFEILATLIEYKPVNLILAISTRSDPPLPLSRLRSQNEILELRSNDLSFSHDDIGYLFNKKLKLNLSEKSIEILKQKTEGWIAGLQLSALTFKGQENVAAYIERMAGDNRYIMDYLMEEVINNQSEELNQFLLKTSILERLSASLCDSLLEVDTSQQMLESLEKNNKFLIPLDNERKWFRYHHLFADLLKQRLQLQAKAELPELHNRASEWFEKNDLLINAIEHAIEAGDKRRALNLIDSTVDSLWARSQHQPLLKFAGYFSKEEILSSVKFCITYAWILTVSGKVEQAEDYLNRLLKEPLEKNLLGRIYGTLNFIYVFKGDSEAAFRYSELATQNISDEDIIWGTWAFISFGEAHLLRFELQQAIDSFQKARKKLGNLNNAYLNLVTESKSAYVLKALGRFREAHAVFKALFDKYLQDDSFVVSIVGSILYSMLGLLEVEQNNIEEGIRLAEKGYEKSQKSTSISFKGYCTILLAEAYYKAGNLDESIKKIEELEQILVNKSAQWVSVLANALKCKLYIFQNELEKAEQGIPQEIRTEKGYTFERYFYHIAKARLLVAQNNYTESMELLESLSKELQEANAVELLIEADFIKAKAHLILNKVKEAKNAIISAIQRSQSEACIRNFICEGEQIEMLLKEIAEEKKTRSTPVLESVSKEFLTKLMDAFEKEKQQKKSSLEDLLTIREIETVQLIAEELSNQEIADKLFISLNTVKTRLKNIYLKLEVDNRRKAVEKAKGLGII